MRRFALDADVLIYAAIPEHPQGQTIRELVKSAPQGWHIGSVLLLPELLSKPLRQGRLQEAAVLQNLLARLGLIGVDEEIAVLAAQLGASYGLKAADAVHLATAVHFGADGFVTNNRKDFGPSEILEIPVLFPDML